jgi:tRNA(adenine34) deaminase
MKKAIFQAQMAMESDEVPVGAIVVSHNQIIAKCHNLTERLTDVTAHAEIQAITSASNFLSNKYLTDCTMYVTVEPCPMCAGALKWSQISRIVYAAPDEKNGFMRFGKKLLHPKTIVEFGLMREECSSLMTDFFSLKRKLKI